MNDVSPHFHILGSLKSEFSTSLYGYWCLLDEYEKLVGLDFGIKKKKKKKKKKERA